MKKKKISFIFLLLFLIGVAFGLTINEGGVYELNIDKEKINIFNDQLNFKESFVITNNYNNKIFIKLIKPNVSGWEVRFSEDAFYLNPNEKKLIDVEFLPNDNFDYSLNIITEDFIKISQDNSNYLGSYNFPIKVVNDIQNVTFSYKVFIDKREKPPVDFTLITYEKNVTPFDSFRFSIVGKNIFNDTEAIVKFYLDDNVYDFKKIFTPKEYVHIFEVKIPMLKPGFYNVKIDLISPEGEGNSFKNWVFNDKIYVGTYKNLEVVENLDKNFFLTRREIEVKNNGNINTTYKYSIDLNFLENLVTSLNIKEDYYSYNSGKLNIEKVVGVGGKESIVIKTNYWVYYLVFVIILGLVLGYYFRVNSNPLYIDNKVYHIVKSLNEGIKSLKVKIEFENIKEKEIEMLELIFRMPLYLSIKEGSFTLVEPKKVLKSNTQYKMIWKFKRFEKGESRILGFTLVNNKGILGDIKLPDLEIIVRVNGRERKYYKSFSTIKN